MNERVKPFFECEYCCKKLTTQARLDKHNCEQKKRALYLASPKGKSTFWCYKSWMNQQGRSVKDASVFIDSQYFNAFVEFVKFCNRVGIPDRKHYIGYMIEQALLPPQWTDTDTYEEYLRYFDRTKTPLEMASITADTLYALSEIFECEFGEIFEHMTSAEIMQLVAARKLSPWILLFSEGFKNHIRTDTTAEQRILINTVIDHKYWSNKFKADPKAVESMRRIVSELKI